MAKLVWVAGVDEVGRGPIAGPVAVGITVMKFSDYKKMKWKGLTDSKKMTEKARKEWADEAKRLMDAGKLFYTVVYRSERFIDRHGIALALCSAIKKCCATISHPTQTLVLLDGGLRAPSEFIRQQTIIKGDQKERIISLASVVAKVSRDALMRRLHKKHPDYGWCDNKGYGTASHYRAIRTHGLSPLHRRSFLKKLQDET